MWRNWLWAKRVRRSERSVAAVIGYVAPGSTRPLSHPDPAKTDLPLVNETVRVHDLRGAEAQPALDQEGFELREHRSRVTDFTDFDQLQSVYLDEAEQIVREAIGAEHVYALARPVLRSDRHEGGERPELLSSHPAPVAHSDFTDRSIGGMVEAVLPRAGLSEPPEGRVAVFNVWRSLRPPPQDRPLALCDIRTVAEVDLVRADSVASPGSAQYEAEFYLIQPNPNHRWCYFSAMTPDEVLLFRQFDSAMPGPSGCPHAAFLDPSCASGAAPRLSIETRICAFL